MPGIGSGSKGYTTAKRVIRHLKLRTYRGQLQNELERQLGLSRSYCSEILSGMQERGLIIRKRSGQTNVVYLSEYYPGHIDKTIRAGMLKSSEYVPLLAHLLRIAKTAGYTVKTRYYNSVKPMLDELSAFALDLAMVPTIPAVNYAVLSSGIIIVMGIASGGSAIVETNSESGDCVLTSESSTMINLVLESTGKLRRTEVYRNPANGIVRFRNRQCCDIAIWEPYLQKVLKSSDISSVIPYSEILGTFPCCVLSTNSEFSQKAGNILADLFESYSNQVETTRNDRFLDQAISEVAHATGFGSDTISRSLESYEFDSNRISLERLRKLGMRLSQNQIDRIFYTDCLDA